MDTFEKLIISLLDAGAMKGCFKKEISELLNISIDCITDVWLGTTLVDGVVNQQIYVSFVDAKIKKEDLIKLPFAYIYENCIVFEVGDSVL